MTPDPFSLHGRRIAVTGANTGIGRGIALAVARAGGAVVGIGRSAMDETAAEIEAAGGVFSSCRVDLSNVAAGVEALDGIMGEAPLDGLVNNAGIIRRADSTEFTEAEWDAVMDVNLKSVFFLSQAFARSCLSAGRPGRIVNIASLLSFQGGIRVPSYTAAKHGVAGITKILANEWAARDINVNAIAPGYIETNNTAALRADPDRSRAILERIPAGRWGVAEDIGAATVFLLAEASRYVHGTVLPVDGGWLAR
ncbi:2-dehydro-3-deoxy-D-gluconate 5-dehydrogenase KduD [Aureimonas phyllosphaerae]|uniref:2-deoxy-D-gluconate 3-dehydrogenase n=1 Tax=Aureimonas phyllosphaerae TaxID=1166078 RepID=A0A7W6BYQ6_9HYPH|nr:2-dehydro-3-deoxy-D-gluconate 5-dehydrogenase KduD [Aureimonas phyllosphaerae]MBB3937588.1 2-deoxy-D-gluconate 3-dehydrogenase [Aureimonas phyllosphaerae]MBB3961612.1 2-deoxy-D-gluconate 3-dehydrogenase [Aureimonas phyllosphaerae]SFF46616.1 2-deoxy-D-gluconate 3-dehydrogenase [Aureimonas phyllosphaerae]